MTELTPKVLIIEDEPQMRRFLQVLLSGHDYQVLEADCASLGMQQAMREQPDVILLDLGLPDQDGLKVTEYLREWSRVPIIIISARGMEDDKVKALDLGADDYLTKPFGSAELLARIRVALRHQQASVQAQAQECFEFGDLQIDVVSREVRCNGERVHLTPTEYKLLTLLLRHAGKVLTHRQILREVWGPAYIEQTHYVRVHMAQLRHKLERDPARPRYLLTETGVGYRFNTDFSG